MKALPAIVAAALVSFTDSGSAALRDQSILWVAWITPREGMELPFEDALKLHQQWRLDQNDSWRWITWRISSGERTGTYAVGTFNHSWEDFQSPPVPTASAHAHFQETVAPYVESVVVHHYSYQSSIGHVPDHLPPRSFSITDEFEIIPGRERRFFEAARQINLAIIDQGVPYYYEWYRLETGGAQPLYARVRLLWNWSDLDIGHREVIAALEERYGKRKATSILAEFSDSVHKHTNRYAQLRPDLFQIP